MTCLAKVLLKVAHTSSRIMQLPALEKLMRFCAAATAFGAAYWQMLPTISGATTVMTSCLITGPYGTWPEADKYAVSQAGVKKMPTKFPPTAFTSASASLPAAALVNTTLVLAVVLVARHTTRPDTRSLFSDVFHSPSAIPYPMAGIATSDSVCVSCEATMQRARRRQRAYDVAKACEARERARCMRQAAAASSSTRVFRPAPESRKMMMTAAYLMLYSAWILPLVLATWRRKSARRKGRALSALAQQRRRAQAARALSRARPGRDVAACEGGITAWGLGGAARGSATRVAAQAVRLPLRAGRACGTAAARPMKKPRPRMNQCV